MRNERITYDDQYHGHPIMTDKDRQLGCTESILQKVDQIMTDMSNRHSKVLFMRYDVRFPQGYDYPNDNETFSRFQESFIKNRKRAGYDPAYIAVRECSREKHQHYHVASRCFDDERTQDAEHPRSYPDGRTVMGEDAEPSPQV